ncbi:hypothetical protein FHU33_2715 [Blastococcus colisei]|uniref:Uncharacterized protein n=1 Tax=Blastococcus colisei TaxID=1564162 RepID=A0A543PGU5_9ACTN|nr:hypothetical protein [Blastococcus colisei]TQN43277.1 hypothetical protein FHU33_2715 [Blastococcus colisei]
MFEDQQVELLPARTTMKKWGRSTNIQSGNIAIAIAVNAGNINFGGDQVNVASAAAAAGSNFFYFGAP